MNESRQFIDARPNKLFFKQIARKIFFEDWAMKLAALVITLALWLGVTGLSTPTTQRLTGVPLSLRYSNNTEVTNSPTQEVDIVITGDKRKIAQVNKNDLVVSLDISDVQPGDRVVSLDPETVNISLPPGIKLDEIYPNRIPVRVEAVDEKDISVNPQTEGDLPEGYEIYEQTVVPAKVRVRGPASFIKSLDFVSTEPIDLSGRTYDFNAKQVPITVSNPKASVLETAVDVAFRIGEKRLERVYSVPVRDSQGRRAAVVLFGGRSLFEGVHAEDMQVEMVRNETGQEVPRLILPPGLEGKVEVRSLRIRP
jgi:hypothetical protein